MFAYCLNNPANGYDPCGTCYHYTDMSVNCPQCEGRPIDKTIIGYQDVTKEVLDALDSAALRGMILRICVNFTASTQGDPRLIAACLTMGTIDRYADFKRLVDHNAPWDIKNEDPWEYTIGTSYPGEGAIVYFAGNNMSLEELGNFTYGYLGYAYGIPYVILLAGSFYAAEFPLFSSELGEELYDWKYIRMGYQYAKQRL